MPRGPKSVSILFDVMKNLRLMMDEYALIEGIAHLSNQEKFPWCVTSKKSLADFYGLSKRTIQEKINKMVNMELLEKNNKGHLRATNKWINAVTNEIEGGAETAWGGAETASQQNPNPDLGGAESAPNHYHSNISLHTRNHENEKEIENLASLLVVHFQQEFGRKGGGTRVAQKGLQRWLGEYTFEEIKQAITVASRDSFWKDKMTLELLFRYRKATQPGQKEEYVDRIGALLAKPKVIEKSPLTDLEIWKTAVDMNINYPYVSNRHKNLMEFLKSEDKYPNKTTQQALIDWLNFDLTKGYVGHCNEIELLDLDNYHPNRVRARKIDLIKMEMYEINNHKKSLDKKLVLASDEEKEKINLEIKQLAEKMRKLTKKLEEYGADTIHGYSQRNEAGESGGDGPPQISGQEAVVVCPPTNPPN